MKRKYRKIIIAFFILLTTVSACAKENIGYDGSGNKNISETMTLMVYMVGSDLEAATAAATNDMKEMEESGVDLSKVNLLIYTGGTPKWHNDALEIPTDSHNVFELTENGFVEVAEYEEMSMGDSESLTRFLQYAYENYQAEAYGLIMWNHGNGPVIGYGSDLKYEKDVLTLPEMERALEASPFSPEQKLGFVGFDACLMASAELACVMDDYADYMIASQEVEPGFGWNYEFLEQCCKVDDQSLIQTIVDKYITYCESYFEENEFFKSDVTLAVTDLSYAKELEEAVNAVFQCAGDDVSGSYNQLALERVETRAFGRATTGSEYDLVDIQALMNSMNASYKKETKAVQDILDKMIIYSGSNTAESCGLSLYYPYYNKKYYKTSWKESYRELEMFSDYFNYLERYEQIWLGTDMKELVSGKLVAEGGESGEYTLQLNEVQAECYADGGYYILRRMGGDVYSPIYYSKEITNEDGLLTAYFDGNVIYYSNDYGERNIPVTSVLDQVDGKTRYRMIALLTKSNGETSEVIDRMRSQIILSVDSQTGEVTVLDFSESLDDDLTTGKKEQVQFENWDEILFYQQKGRYLTRDDQGIILQFEEWPENDWILWHERYVADGLHFSFEPLYDDGSEYFLMFDLMDVQGNRYGSELYPITLAEQEEKEEKVNNVGVLEGDSIMIFDRDGVALTLNLVKNHNSGIPEYLFSAENSNDFTVNVYIDDILLNDRINCSDGSCYFTVDAGGSAEESSNAIKLNCLLEQIEYPERIRFCAKVYSEEAKKTIVSEETFEVDFAPTASAKISFSEFLGVYAKEQVLLEEEGICATLLGVGNMSHGAYLDSILEVENTSDEAQNVRIDLLFNETLVDTDEFYDFDDNEITLQPGQVYFYTWRIWEGLWEEKGLEEISSIAYELHISSENRTVSKKLDVELTDH